MTVGFSVGQVDDLYQSILILECLVDCTHNPQTHRFQFFFDPKRFVEKVKDETLADELRMDLGGKDLEVWIDLLDQLGFGFRVACSSH